MAISKKGLDDYWARKMRRSSKVKQLTDEELDRKLEVRGIVTHTEMRFAQKVCFLLAWEYPRYLIFLGMGGGKTKVSLDLFSNRKLFGELDRLLVLVPNVVNLGAWGDEVARHAPELSFQMLDGAGADARWSQVEGGADVVVMTFQGFSMLCSQKQKNDRTKKNEMKPHDPSIRRMASNFGMVVLDESTTIKSKDSLAFKCINKLGKSIKYIYALTGTPFDKDPRDLWSQFFAIDRGETLGETIGLYRAAFFREESNYWGGVDYIFRRQLKHKLARRIENRSVRFSEAECQDLPPSVGGIGGQLMKVSVELPKAQIPFYQKQKTEYREAGKKMQLTPSYMKMRTICSGWLGATDESGERMELEFPQCASIDAVIELLHEIPENEPVIVVCWYQITCGLLMKRLKKEKVPALLINGKTPKGQKLKNMQEFQGGKKRVLVATTAISKGVNLQDVCRYMIFLESPDSQIERSQIERRILRERKSKDGKSCYFYDIVTRVVGEPSVNDSILESLTTGKNLHDCVVDKA